MTATHKSWLTRRRVFAVAFLLVVVLAVAGLVFWTSNGNPEQPVKATFVQSEGTGTLAVILLTNGSRSPLWVHEANDPSDNDKSELVIRYKIVSHSPTGEVTWTTPQQLGLQCVLEEFSAFSYKIKLPTDGRTGHVAVLYETLPKKLPAFLDAARDVWWLVHSAQLKSRWVECEQEIQCPRVLPNGTVEPARLVPKGERKTP
jgi:hypothetical protein